LAEAEDKVKKLEGAKEKVEKSKEEAIQNLNERIRFVDNSSIMGIHANKIASLELSTRPILILRKRQWLKS